MKPERLETKGDPDEAVCAGCGESDGLWTLAWVPRGALDKILPQADIEDSECRNESRDEGENCGDVGTMPRGIYGDTRGDWGELSEPKPGHREARR